MRAARFVWFILMMLVGAAAGLYYTWVVNPVEFVDATFNQLRQDYKADYVLMTAEIYDDDNELYQAVIRLDKLAESSAETAVKNALDTAERLGYSDADYDMMSNLYNALTGEVPTTAQEEEIPEAVMTDTELPTMIATSETLSPDVNEFPANNTPAPTSSDKNSDDYFQRQEDSNNG